MSNGDYSFYVPKNSAFNIERDLYFDNRIMIERKGSLEELSGNLTTNRARFEEELATFSGKKYLLIESANYHDIINGNYETKFNKSSYAAGIHTFDHRYDLRIIFVPQKEYTGYYIYGVLKYYLKNNLR